MHRLLAALLLAAILAPSTAFALDATPLPVPLPAIACPAPEIGPDGVMVVPPDAPADCAYLSGLPGIETGCIPPESIGSDPFDSTTPVCPSVIAPGPDGSCSVSSDGTSTCDDPGPTDLPPTGLHFTITAIALSGVRYELTAGEMTIGRDGTFSATLGCNRFVGSSTGDADSFTVIGPLAQTKMYCPELMDAEAAFATILGAGPLRFTTNAAPLLVVSESGIGSLELVDSLTDGEPVAPPVSTRYELRAVLLADGQRYEIENGYLLITEGALTASAGCNTIGGEVATIDGGIVVGDLIATEMWCEGRMNAEAALITVLTGGEAYITDNGDGSFVRFVSATGSLELTTGDTPVDDATGGSARGEIAFLLLLLPALAGACALVIGLTHTTRREA
jgi:heat shock protein HslJ